ncbi:MAG TPA: peptidylprolyl isomerase [Gaiellaceae bacterium]|jgi:foldase protein PrsA
MRRLFLLLLVAPLALLAASCGGGGGGGSSISKNDVAVVGGDHIARADLDRRMSEAKCSYDLQKRTFPKAGSAEYQAIQTQILQSLVQRAEIQQKAPGLGATVSDKQVEDQLKQLKKQYFGGSEKRYQAELEKQCVTDPEVRADIRSNLLSDAVYKKVTTGAKVSEADAKVYYLSHSVNYTQPQTRVVRHILVKDKQTADKLYAQLKAGADFATLAKKFSQDPGSKSQGGRLTISRGQTVPEFDRTAFELKTGALSKPVKTQFGWHIIQALKPATPRKATPFAQVKEAIRQQLLQQKKSDALKRWLDGVKAEYASKTKYATGLAPAATTTPPTTTG